MSEKRVFTISELNKYVKYLIDNDIFLRKLWIKGEISNLKMHSSGHIYFSLKDESSVISAVMFRYEASGLKFKPENGMMVTVCCSIRVYETAGSYQAYVEEMQPDGEGGLSAMFEQLKAKLFEEGLFDAAHKKPIPKFPEKIGVVTSPTGAAVRDMLNILCRRWKYAEIYIYPVLVQGQQAPVQIIEGIRYFDEKFKVDTIITGRGGGSAEDLWAFNDETLARTIYNCSTPIISAVGHEIDFTIADFTADLRAATPSEAAERAVPAAEDMKTRLKTAAEKLKSGLSHNISQKKLMLNALDTNRVFSGFEYSIADRRQSVDILAETMEANIKLMVERKIALLKLAASRLDDLSPLNVLARGYSIVFGEKGKPVSSAENVKKGENITIKLQKGEVGAVITEINRQTSRNNG